MTTLSSEWNDWRKTLHFSALRLPRTRVAADLANHKKEGFSQKSNHPNLHWNRYLNFQDILWSKLYQVLDVSGRQTVLEHSRHGVDHGLRWILGVFLAPVGGQESAAPPAGPFHGVTRRTIQRPLNDRGGGCAAGENDRRAALRFPALRCTPMPRRVGDPRSQENHHDANDATECNGPAAFPEKIVNRF
jgi:hypothetical protein